MARHAHQGAYRRGRAWPRGEQRLDPFGLGAERARRVKERREPMARGSAMPAAGPRKHCPRGLCIAAIEKNFNAWAAGGGRLAKCPRLAPMKGGEHAHAMLAGDEAVDAMGGAAAGVGV